MHEVNLVQGSPEWLDFRRNHRMASETPAVLNVSPYQSMNDIRRIKRGEHKQFVNDAMRRGVQFEPVARAAYESDYEIMRPLVLVDGVYGASLDGLSMDGKTIFECKVPANGRQNERWQLASKGDSTPYDYAQVQHQLMVSKAEQAHLVIYDADNADYLVVDIKPDVKFWEQIRTVWDAFWETIAVRDDKPWVDASLAYLAAKQRLEEAEAQAEQARQAVIALMQGDFNCGAGISVTRSYREGNVDWKRVQTEHLTGVDLTPFRKRGTEVITIKEQG